MKNAQYARRGLGEPPYPCAHEWPGDAETACFQQLQRILSCPGHEFERGSHRNGSATCKHCRLWQIGVFEPLERCFVCDAPTYHGKDKDGRWYCATHYAELPRGTREIDRLLYPDEEVT